MERSRPMTLRDLALANQDHPKWRDFAKRYQTPVETAPQLEVDTENPYGHEGRTIFSAETCEGARE